MDLVTTFTLKSVYYLVVKRKVVLKTLKVSLIGDVKHLEMYKKAVSLYLLLIKLIILLVTNTFLLTLIDI